METIVQKATARLSKYLHSLADQNSQSVGFLPEHRFGEYAAKGRVLVAFENAEPCGYIMRGPHQRLLKIYQTCVQFDARRITHATHLVDQLKTDAIASGVERIRLHCATDLAANEFWRATGFVEILRTRRRRRNGRELIRWELPLPAESARVQREAKELRSSGLENLKDFLCAGQTGAEKLDWSTIAHERSNARR